MRTFQLHYGGQVQGVGFRPLAYQLANNMGLTGTIANGLDGVTIFLNGSKRSCYEFYNHILHHPPVNARITHHTIEEIPDRYFTDFSIMPSNTTTKSSLVITPDLAMCEACRNDLKDPANRRFQYPFVTCLHCGPRYSIIQRLPYDRENTTMDKFKWCPECGKEYNSPFDRRHYSQTNSCPRCAITLRLTDHLGNILSTDAHVIITQVEKLLNKGKIVAVKGIGGYLLLCDTTPEAIGVLRKRKHRPSKPLALLYPSIEVLRKETFVNQVEERALLSKESPIVLLKMRKFFKGPRESIAPQLDKVGAMLPYAPLLELIMQNRNRPIIATSANISQSPILYRDDEALKGLSQMADYFVINSRDIVVPQDDSVVQFAPYSGKSIFLRRSRGYAPSYLPLPFNDPVTSLAMGGDLKSAFALNDGGRIYVSQYLGDLGSFDTQESYQHTLNHLMKLSNANIERVLIDKHPHYYSSVLGENVAMEHGARLMSVQHHKAHLSAVLAENHLLTTAEPVLGVVWDGTGWGDDNMIWGGEFFHFENHQITRLAHLEYFDHWLGDKMSLEPRLSALSICKDQPELASLLKEKFSEPEWKLYTQMMDSDHSNGLKTSSIGRLFDGVASLLGLCDKSSHEGEAALYLESLARRIKFQTLTSWSFQGQPFSLKGLMHFIIQDLKSGARKEEIAYRFHLALVQWVGQLARQHNYNKIAFSGGVFQNALLVDLLSRELGKEFVLYFHQQLSPNDECIGFGQLAYAYMQQFVNSGNEMSKEMEMRINPNVCA